jgi:polyribonucleotide 5'-hydroxyl-kinase
VAGSTAERWYTFGDEAKACLSTLNGCQVELVGSASTEYLAEEEGTAPLQRMYANLHLYLEARRIHARDWLKEDLKRQGTGSIFRTLAASSHVLNEGGAPPSSLESEPGETSVYRSEGQGPRVMVVGPESSGKSTLVKYLTNWALKSPAVCNPANADTDKNDDKTDAGNGQRSEVNGWWPCIVSADPSIGCAPVPGTVSILPVSPVPQAVLPSSSPAFPYGLTSLTTGTLPPVASAAHASNVHALWVGRESVRDNEKHAHRVIEHLALALEKRLARDPRARCSGVFIDTPGVIASDAKSRYTYIQHCVRVFKVDTIVVIGHEKLNIEMNKLFNAVGQSSGVSVVKLPKSGGVVEVDTTFKQHLRSLQVRTYFYGGGMQKNANQSSADSEQDGQAANGTAGDLAALAPSHVEPLGGLPFLSPFSTTIPFEVLETYSVGQDSKAPSSALPIGASRTVTETQLVKLDPINSTTDQAHLLHSILALVQPPRGGGGPGVPDSQVDPPPTDDELLGAPILGFIHVSDIDLIRKKITVLSPSPGRLPSKTALIGTLDWQDS